MGQTLQRLIAGIDLDYARAASERPHAIRRRLQVALESSEFYLDCAQVLLNQVVSEPDAQFLFADPRWRYTLQVFCWPPGFSNDPHLHETWAVSAVMVNSLLVFHSTLSERDCLASKPLLATSGQVGVLMPPQFHCLRNAGNETAITFHVFSLDDAGRDKVHLEGRPALASRFDDDDILAIARAAAVHGDARSIGIARTAFSAVGNAARLDLVKLMVRLDPLQATRMARTLAQLVGGNDGRRLFELVENLEMAARQGAL